MRLYDYRCRTCGSTRESTSNDDLVPCSCGGLYRRCYRSVQLRPSEPFQPHFNYSVGRWIETTRDFKRALHDTAIDNSLQTGLDHHYEMIDPAELSRTPPSEGVIPDGSSFHSNAS